MSRRSLAAAVRRGLSSVLVAVVGFALMPPTPLSAQTVDEVVEQVAGEGQDGAQTPHFEGELPERRTRSSMTVLNGDGTLTTSVFAGPIHFRGAEDRWEAIDSEIVDAPEHGYAYRNKANSFTTRFKSELDDEYLRVEAGGHAFTLTLEGAAKAAARRPDRKEQLGYPGVMPGVDLRYDVLADGLKETLVLSDARGPNSFRFLLAPVGEVDLEPRRRDDGGWDFYAAPRVDPLFSLDPPRALDSATDGEGQPNATQNATLDVKKTGRGFVLEVSVDRAWLAAPERVFPVLLDPTITIQPPVEDASYAATCANCLPYLADKLYMGGDTSNVWRAALQFNLGEIPAGADITAANLQVYWGSCITNSAGYCGNANHQIDLHRLTNGWTTSSVTSGIAFDQTATASHLVDVLTSAAPRWLRWDVSGLVRNWTSGLQTNFGVLLKRSGEALNTSGPVVYGRRAAETTLQPKLEVTYPGEGVNLLPITTLHSNGAALRWTKWASATGATFDRYEVHRSLSAGFTPGADTLLTTIRDAAVTTFRDTTAAPGRAFTYKIVANSVATSGQTVTLPADGQATKILQPGPADGQATHVGEFSGMTNCANYGAEDRLAVGPQSNAVLRSLVRFDVRDIPATAQITSATMSLWHAYKIDAATTIQVHPAAADWREGTGVTQCTANGATWYDTQGGSRWRSNGADFDATPVASKSHATTDPAGWDDFDLTGLVRGWTSAQRPNLGVVLRAANETLGAGTKMTYHSDDYGVAPSLRPKLAVTYLDGSKAQGPTVALSAPGAGTVVTGTAVTLAATATDDRRVDKVEFLVDGVVVATDTGLPYAVAWNSSTATNGNHTFSARATDDAGNVTVSAGVVAPVENSGVPTTTLTGPGTATSALYRDVVAADVPTAWYRLGEAAGATTATDSTSNALHGTYTNVAAGVPGALAVDTNTAARFPGVNDGTDQISVPDNAKLNFTTSDFSVEAWVRTTTNGERAIIGKSAGTVPNWRLTVTDDSGQTGRVRSVIEDGTVSRTAYGPAIRVDDGNWHHVLAVYDRDVGTTIYVDGVGQSTAGPMTGSVSNTSPLRIGDTGSYPPLIGDLDEVALYPVALTAARAAAHYNAGVVQGTTVRGTPTMTANAGDDRGVTRVEFYVDDVRIGEDTTAPYSVRWNTFDATSPAYDGAHVLTSRAYDAGGQVATSAPVTVTVANTAGTHYRAGIVTTPAPMQVTYDPAAATQLTYGVDVTITNSSGKTWKAAETAVNYRWISPDPVPVVTEGGTVQLASDLATGTSRTVRLAVQPPVLAPGTERAQYRLEFDVRDTAAQSSFAKKGNKPNDNPVVVNKALAAGLGLERYYQYDGEETGAGMGHLVNVANGNSLLRWTPFQSPGRGLSTVMDLTYNSLEQKSESPAGNNWSLSISGLIRLGNPLDVHPNKADEISGRANRWVQFTDGDGTTHRFEGNQAADGTVYWEAPPGVHLYLRNYSDTDPARKWALTRPDRVTFFFDVDGYPTSVEDGNGNRLTFTLEATPPAEDPGGPKKRITRITDPAGNDATPSPSRSYSITYYSKADAKKPQIRGKVKRITDHTGNALEFTYYEDGNLLRLTQKGGTKADGSFLADRSFVFTYTTSNFDAPAIPDANARANPEPKTPNQSALLYSVRDPRGTETRFTYFGPGSSQDRGKLASRTDRAGAVTSYAYDIVNRVTTMTRPLSRVTRYAYDTNGKPVSLTNPKGETTTLTWSADFHVTKITEPTGAFTEYAYNANGYVTEVVDQLRNRTTLVYDNLPVDANDVSGKWKAGRTIPHISQLVRKTDPKGTATATPTDDFQWQFLYDAKRNMTRVTDPMRFSTSYAYDLTGQVTTVTDANANPTSFVYDANGLPTRITDAKGQVTQFGYDADGLLLWSQDAVHSGATGANPREYRTYFDYDSFARLGRQSAPKSTTVARGQLIWTAADFDPNDNLVSEWAPAYGQQFTLGARTTMAYDLMDRRTLITNPDRSVDPAGERTAMEYDAAGRMTRVTKPKGVLTPAIPEDYATTFTYDALDRVIRRTRSDVDAAGNVLSTQNMHACYNLAGDNVWRVAPKANLATVDCAAAKPAFTTVYEYDAAHRRTAEVDPDGRRRSVAYDANGNVAATTDAQGTSTTREYDQRNLLVKVTQPLVTGTNPRNVVTRIEYDPVGNRKRVVSPRAWDASADKVTFTKYVTTYQYDRVNQLVRIDLPSEGPGDELYQHRAYDAGGRLAWTSLSTKVADAASVPESIKTLIEYWDTGWIRTQKENPSARVQFDYTAEGWQLTRTPEKGTTGQLDTERQMRWEYFADGQTRERSDEGMQKTTYTYDANNNLTAAHDASGVTKATRKPMDFTNTWDGLDRIVQHRQKAENDAAWRVTSYTFDLNDNQLTRTDNAEEGNAAKPGRRHEFTYSQADWLTVQVDRGEKAGDASDDQRITTSFTPTGWESRRVVERWDTATGTWKNKQTTAWTHFANGKLRTMQTLADRSGTSTVVESHDVSYTDTANIYVNGNRTRDVYRKDNPDTTVGCRTTTCTETYTYDARDRLINSNNGRAGGATSYTLDPAGNITQEVTGGTTKTMTYTGNQIQTLSVGGSTAWYWHDPTDGNLDCVTTTSAKPTTCSVATGGAAPSNLALDYNYDYLRRMESFRSYSAPGTVDDTADYTYDALDRVVEQRETHGGATAPRTTTMGYLGLTNSVTSEEHRNSTGALTRTKSYSYDAWGNRIGMTDTAAGAANGNQYTYGYDVHGSVSMLINQAGTATASYGYTPYGDSDTSMTKGDVSTDDPLNPYRYTGKRFDSGSKTLDMGARRFGPDTSRFLQSDRYAQALSNLGLSVDPLTSNRYSLAGGNPLSFVEVDGHMVTADGGGGGSRTPTTSDSDGDSGSGGWSLSDTVGAIGDAVEEAGEFLGKYSDDVGEWADDAFEEIADAADDFRNGRYSGGLLAAGERVDDAFEKYGKPVGKWLKWGGRGVAAVGAALSYADYIGQGKSWQEAAGRTGIETGLGLGAGAAVTAGCAAAGVATFGVAAVACGVGAIGAGIAGSQLGKKVGEWAFNGGPERLAEDVGEFAGDAWDTASGAAGDAWDSASDAAGDAWDTASDWGGEAAGAVDDAWDSLWD